MTLRELIQEVTRLGELKSLAEKIIELHPDWADQLESDVLRVYTNVSEEIEDLPGDDELSGHVIVVEEISNTFSNLTEKWTDVHLLDSDGEKWAIDMTDWNGLVDLPIKDNTCDRLSHRLAHILYEITFWGRTRNSVLHESEQLQFAAKDKDNIIEISMEDFIKQCDELN